MRDGLGAVQKVLLLGGTSEIGLEIVRKFADESRLSHVWLAGRSAEALSSQAKALEGRYAGLTATPVRFDATEYESHAAEIADVFDQGPIDCVISAFGQLGNNDDLVTDVEAIRNLLEVNYVAAVTTGTIVVKHLKAQGCGSFVVLSSVAAERSRADNYVYASTKAGLDSWASGASDALRASGVQVLVVRPGFIHTRMTEGVPPAPLATTPDVVAEAVVKGLRRGSSLIWAPAAVRPLMSTLRHLPRPVYRVVAKRAAR